MATLITLPNEILFNILKYIDPADLGGLPIVCKALHAVISNDSQIFKAVYLQVLDEPTEHCKPLSFDFKKNIQDFVRARALLTGDKTVDEKAKDVHFVASFATELLRQASSGESRNLEYLSEWFDETKDKDKTDNIEAFLCRSTTFNRARLLIHDGYTPASFAERQASAKLHVHYGSPIASPRRTKYHTSYPFAVSMVYDLRNYRRETFWGPYLPDSRASVDWEKMEAVLLVLGFNLSLKRLHKRSGPFKPMWTEPWLGASPDSYISVPLDNCDSESTTDDIEDPYGVQGTWMRVVCFLDFHDLFAYNFTTGQPPPDEPRPALNTHEATRLICMQLRVTKTEKPGPDDGQELPVVHFEGVSRSLHISWDPNANSNLRGTVRLTKEGEVRWQTISVYDGEERWASEGIQVGGIRSARGILGHWFDKDHDIHGPAGPTAFWKISDMIESEKLYDTDEADDAWQETDDNVEVIEVD